MFILPDWALFLLVATVVFIVMLIWAGTIFFCCMAAYYGLGWLLGRLRREVGEMDSVSCPRCGSPAIPMPDGKQWFCHCGLGAFTPKLPHCDWCSTPILGDVIRWDYGKFHLSCFREYYDEVEVHIDHALLEMIENSEALACLFHCGDSHIEAYPDRDGEVFVCPECEQELDWDEMWMRIDTVRGIRVAA